ncbi:hypothetical protein PAEPH01_0307 [Pancytospora epiphaga]|nr:hypothetical protein PAEPH01_0307 [Pancytospora epiphaga]
MLFLINVLLNLVHCGNIYWVNADSNKISKNNCAVVTITSEEYPHKVELVTNTDNEPTRWKTMWSQNVTTNKIVYCFKEDTPRRKYYAFKLNEDSAVHYTKSMYLSNDGKWMDPNSDSEKIEADKKGKKNKKQKNTASSCIVLGGLLTFIGSLLIL